MPTFAAAEHSPTTARKTGASANPARNVVPLGRGYFYQAQANNHGTPIENVTSVTVTVWRGRRDERDRQFHLTHTEQTDGAWSRQLQTGHQHRDLVQHATEQMKGIVRLIRDYKLEQKMKSAPRPGRRVPGRSGGLASRPRYGSIDSEMHWPAAQISGAQQSSLVVHEP